MPDMIAFNIYFFNIYFVLIGSIDHPQSLHICANFAERAWKPFLCPTLSELPPVGRKEAASATKSILYADIQPFFFFF